MAPADVKDILFEALERTGEGRDRYLAEIAATEPALRDRVVKLLKAHEAAGDFLSGSPAVRPTSWHEEPEFKPGDLLGRYRIEERVGEGGFGEVYCAEQLDPVRRRVALKILKPGMDSRQVIARFQAERQALALMDHPSIATVLDAGRTETGRPYFVMEFVEGEPITRYCDDHRLDVPARLRLFTSVCHAVQHAHQKGLIHRDIKPSNVMVVEVDGQPVPKVIDFGIAKAIGADASDATALTDPKQLIGTPAYMSPEQFAAPEQVDTRTDVYSLGVLLYELLTGAPPYDAERLRSASLGELDRIVRDEDPPRPSSRLTALGDELPSALKARRADLPRLRSTLRGDLDWITARAIEKDRDRRYPTANMLALDIQRHLRSEPVDAGPPSAAYRFRKFARRHRPQLIAGAVAACSLAALLVASVWFAISQRALSHELQIQLNRADVMYDRLQSEFDHSQQLAADLQAQLERANALADFAQNIIAGVDPARARGQDTALLETILETATGRVDEALGDHPVAAVAMLNTIGYTWLQIANYDEAEATFRRALTLAEKHLGRTHEQHIDARLNLGSVLAETSRYRDGADLFIPLVDDLRAALGPDHPDTIEAMSNLATIHRRLGNLHEARALSERVLDTRARLLGPEHEDTLTATNNLAALLGDMGEREESLRLLQRVLDAQLRTDGEDHPRTLATMNNVAAAHRDLGHDDQAQAMFRRVLDVKHRILPPEHPSTLITTHNLASLLTSRGRLDEAEAMYTEIVEIAHRTLGERDLRTIGFMNGLGRVYSEQGRYDEALDLASRAHAAMCEIAAPGHPNAVIFLSNVASLQNELGRLDDAEASAREAIRLATAIWGPAGKRTCRATRTLAEILTKADRFEDAETLLLDLHTACERAHGPAHEETTRCAQALAELYDDWERPDEASIWEARTDGP